MDYRINHPISHIDTLVTAEHFFQLNREKIVEGLKGLALMLKAGDINEERMLSILDGLEHAIQPQVSNDNVIKMEFKEW